MKRSREGTASQADPLRPQTTMAGLLSCPGSGSLAAKMLVGHRILGESEAGRVKSYRNTVRAAWLLGSWGSQSLTLGELFQRKGSVAANAGD